MDDSIIDHVPEVSNTADPNFNSLLYNLNLDQDVKARLSIYLKSVYYGNSEVYLSPIAKDNNPRSVLESWDSIFNKNKHRMNGTLIDLENSNRLKFGPRSIAVPWKSRREGVYDYFKVGKHSITLGNTLKGHRGNLRPISYERAIPYLKNSTNSGLPYFTRKSKIKDKLYNPKVLANLKYNEYPCILFTRTQEGLKTRTVWGYPIYDTLNEMRYYQPLLGYQRNQYYRSALIGPDKVDESITSLILNSIRRGLTLISIDFSAYDASVKYDLQRCAFDYIKSLFQEKESSEIDYIFKRFNTIGILTPDGVIKGSHGVPSGSTFTNEVDSIVQYLVAKWTGVVNDSNLQIQGDDGAYAIDESDVRTLFDCFRSVGLNVNESKSYTSKDYVIYLQKLFHYDYINDDGLIGGIYPTYRAIERILFQERWSDFEDYGLKGSDYYSIRTITILENCKYHPLFKEIVQFIYNLDKYKLGYSKRSVSLYSNLTNQGPGLGGLFNNQYGDNVAGINNFETVKLIKRLA